jgi:hypothetical protein
MTSEQRQYLKGAIDAHRRAALAADGDRKFRHYQAEDTFEDGNGQIRPLVAVGLILGMAMLMSLALFIEHLAR